MESIKAMGMKGSFLWSVFLLFKGLHRMFSFLLLVLGDKQEEEKTSVGRNGNVW